jgi:hypothetical protein
VRPDDGVCLLCEQQSAGDLGQVGATFATLLKHCYNSLCQLMLLPEKAAGSIML